MTAALSRTGALVRMPDRPIRLREPYATLARCIANGCGAECDLRAAAEREIDRRIAEACEAQNARRADTLRRAAYEAAGPGGEPTPESTRLDEAAEQNARRGEAGGR